MTPLRVKLLVGLCLAVLCSATHSTAQTATNASTGPNAVKAEMEAAIHQVEKIVNQTVPAYRRTEGMQYSEFSPGWFRAGAIKPDFNHVDVRTTRETANYEQHEYCTSDLIRAWCGGGAIWNLIR